MHDDTSDPRRDESLGNESLGDGSAAAPRRPAEPYTLAQGLPLLDALAYTPAPTSAHPLVVYPLRLHKDPPLWRFGH